MKTFKIFTATLFCLIAISLKTKAQSRITLDSGLVLNLDSALVFKPDSNNFVKKPHYSSLNIAPVPLPNAYTPKQTPAAPMPVLKILLKKED